MLGNKSYEVLLYVMCKRVVVVADDEMGRADVAQRKDLQ